ncbi:hypothetical protein E3P99_01179 [Wallemia hederae]|uniref:Uncharacterized protein n=1 Tax=Wallemia hederae TaxID=1540922 RepID=A0A4T0FRS2_9BASI|nr:hypothetical protein E3P99_01179 [Wallemia hederae]
MAVTAAAAAKMRIAVNFFIMVWMNLLCKRNQVVKMESAEISAPALESTSPATSSRNLQQPTSYSRKELLRLYKSPLVKAPDSLEPFSVWFGEYTAPPTIPSRPSISSPNASSPNAPNSFNRFRRNNEEVDSPRSSKYKNAFERALGSSSNYTSQPPSLGPYRSPNSRHPDARTLDREAEFTKNKFSIDKTRAPREDRRNQDKSPLSRKEVALNMQEALKSNDGDWRKGGYVQERQRSRKGRNPSFEDDSSPAWLDDTSPRDSPKAKASTGPFGSGSAGVDSIQAFKAQMREKERRDRLFELGIDEESADNANADTFDSQPQTHSRPPGLLEDEDQVDAANDETFGGIDAANDETFGGDSLEPTMSNLTMNDDPAILNTSNATRSQNQSPSSTPALYAELGNEGSNASSEGTPKVAEKAPAASRFARFFDAKPKAMDAQAKWLDAQRKKESEPVASPPIPTNDQPDMQRVLAMLQTSSSSTPVPQPPSVKDISRPTSTSSAGADLTAILHQQQQAAFRNQQLQQQQQIIMQQRKEREQELQRERMQREHQALLLAQAQRRQQSPQDPAILNALSLARAKGSPAAMSQNVLQQQQHSRMSPMNDPRAAALQEYQMRQAYERQRQLQQSEMADLQPEVSQQQKLQEMLIMQQQQAQLRQMQQANAMRGAPPEHLAALIRGGGSSQSPSNATNPQAGALLMQQIQQQQGQVPSTISPPHQQQHSQANEMLLQQQRLLAQQRGMQAAQAQAQAQAAALAAAIQQQQQQQHQQLGGMMQQQQPQHPDIHHYNSSFDHPKMGGPQQSHMMDVQQQRQKQAQLMALLNGGR